MEKILVIDDDEKIGKMLKRILENEGYSCEQATSVSDARRQIQGHHFGLILCDIRMPDESGIEFIKQDLSKYPDTAFIMITGVDDLSVAELCLELGAYDYIRKPIDKNRLLIGVSNALRRLQLEIKTRHYIEEIKQIREDYIHIKKLEGIREITGAICHEINQPLQAILGHLEILKRDEIDDPSFLTNMEEQIYQIIELVNKLKGITKYETTEYLPGSMIFDIEKASSS